MASSSQHRCVFVGNIPYDATEEQLIDIWREVGPVVFFRLVIDSETGKPKGYAFCEYKDEETALSARCNLQGYEINGRQLWADFAENDKNADRNRERGRGGPGLVANSDPQKKIGGPAILGESSQHQPIGLHVAITAAAVMAGALGGHQVAIQSNQTGLLGQSSLASDPLALHLAKMSKAQLNEIISALKVMAQQSKDAARQLLLARLQLSKALFQTQIMLGLVNPKVLQMANIRQLSGQSVVSLPQDACQGLRTVVPNLPILTPLARQSQVPVLTQYSLSQNQLPVASQPPSQAQTLVSRYTGDAPPQHVAFPEQSGAPAHPSIRPQIQKAPPISSSMPDAVSKVADRSAHRNNAYLNIHRSSTDDAREQNNRPSKLLKLDDGRSTFLPGSSSASNTLGSGPSKTFAAHSMTTYPLPKPEVSPYVDKQSSQLPSDVESALLQQVLSLTPEQVSSLPPDQQRQVIWLQQALRQDQLQAS